jgi:acetyl esterase/lipase
MKIIILFFFWCLLAKVCIAQETFPIWPDKPRGSEDWNWHERRDSTELKGDPLVFNVAQPVLDFYPAKPNVSNGTSVIICPGGGFYYLHIKTEGTDVANWLNKRGISAFVLKYRLVHCDTNYPLKERDEKRKDTAGFVKLVSPLVPLAIADAKQAIAYVRQHATQLGVSPDKIGLMGFSAGGTLATASAFEYTKENRPDFVAPIYPYVPPMLSMNVVKDTPPLFIAAASDDDYHLVPASINLYKRWLEAGASAELHIYSKGGHGFGMNKQDQPSDTWIERFADWLQVQRLLNK